MRWALERASLEEVTVQLRTNTWGRHSWVGWWWVQERSEGSGSGRLERNVRRSKLRTHGDFRELEQVCGSLGVVCEDAVSV